MWEPRANRTNHPVARDHHARITSLARVPTDVYTASVPVVLVQDALHVELDVRVHGRHVWLLTDEKIPPILHHLHNRHEVATSAPAGAVLIEDATRVTSRGEVVHSRRAFPHSRAVLRHVRPRPRDGKTTRVAHVYP